MADSGGKIPPGIKGHGGSEGGGTRNTEAKEVTGGDNIQSPNTAPSGGGSVPKYSQQDDGVAESDAANRSGDPTIHAVDDPNKQRTKNKNERGPADTQPKRESPNTLTPKKCGGQFVGQTKEALEKKGSGSATEQKEVVHNVATCLNKKPTDNETKPDLLKDDSEAESDASKQGFDRLEPDKTLSHHYKTKSREECHENGQNLHGQQSSLKPLTKHEQVPERADLSGSFIMVDHGDCKDVHSPGMDSAGEMSHSRKVVSGVSKTLLSSMKKKKEGNEEIVKEHPECSDSTARLRSQFMKQHCQKTIGSSEATIKKLEDDTGQDGKKKEKDDIENEGENKDAQAPEMDTCHSQNPSKKAEVEQDAMHDGSAEMTVCVKTLTGKEIKIDARLTDTLENIKVKIEDKEGIAPNHQRLIKEGGEIFDDQRTLLEYGFDKETTIHLVVKQKKDDDSPAADSAKGMPDHSKEILGVNETEKENKNVIESEKEHFACSDTAVEPSSESMHSQKMAPASTQTLNDDIEHKDDKNKDKDERKCIEKQMQDPRDDASLKNPLKIVEAEQDTTHDVSADAEDAELFKNDFSNVEEETEEQRGETEETNNYSQAESNLPVSGASSIENISEGCQDETGFDETNMSLQFQLRSLPQMPDENRKEMKHDRVLSFGEQTEDAVTDGIKKCNTLSAENEEGNLDPKILSKNESPKLEAEEYSASSRYKIEKVKNNYILHLQNFETRKLPQLKGKLNVSVDGNYILVGDEIEYVIKEDNGAVRIAEMKEVEVENDVTCDKAMPQVKDPATEKTRQQQSNIGQLTKTNEYSVSGQTPVAAPRKNPPGKTKRQLLIPLRVYDGKENAAVKTDVSSFSEYLKWMFILKNSEARKQLNSQEIWVDNGEIYVQLSHKQEGKPREEAIQNCLSASLNGMSSLRVACFEGNGNAIDICGKLELSKIVKEHHLYIHIEESSQKIFLVCFVNLLASVDQEFRQALALLGRELKGHYVVDTECQDECKISFEHCNVQEKIASKCHGVSFAYSPDKNRRSGTFRLQAQVLIELEQARVLVQEEIIRKFTYNSFPFSSVKNIKSVDSNFAVHYLERKIKELCQTDFKWDIHSEVDSTAERVIIAGCDQAAVDRVARAAISCISYKEFRHGNLDESSKSLLLTCLSDNKDEVSAKLSEDSCRCFGSADCLKMIESRLANNETSKTKSKCGKHTGEQTDLKTKTKSVNVKDFSTYEFIKNVMVKTIQEEDNVSVEPRETSEKFGFVIKGYEDKQLKKYEDLIQSIADKVKEKKMSVTMPRSRETKYGASILKVEKECNVLIRTLQQPILSTIPDKMTWVFDKGHCLILSCGAAEDSWEDLIVDVKMFEPQCKPNLSKVGDKTRTQLFVPVYQNTDEAGKQPHMLSDAMEAVLKMSVTYDCIHICMPMAERFGWPLKKFAKRVLSSIIKHLEKTELQLPVKVELCVTADDFDECLKIITEASPRHFEESIFWDISYGRQKNQTNQIRINVVEGQLDKFETDVIVNTTSSNLDLKTGAVSKSILNQAGGEIQKECRKKYPNGIKDGKVAVTKGYKLKCRHVFHGAFEYYRQQENNLLMQKIKTFVMDCLGIANFLGHKRIAFPVIGAGGLGYPVEQVVDIILSAIQDFEKEFNDTHGLQEVSVVVYGSTTVVKTFEMKISEQAKRKGKKKGNANITSSNQVRCAEVISNVEIASLDNCGRADALLVFWDKSLPEASFKTSILEKMGKEASKEFFQKRDALRTTLKPLATSAGLLQNRIIVHILVKDVVEGLRDSFKKGILMADNEKSYSLAVYFSKESPFLPYKDRLVEEFVEAMKEVAANLENLCHVALVFEWLQQPDKYFQIFEDKMAFSEDHQVQKGSICCAMKIVGYEDCIKNAEILLRKMSFSTEKEVLNETVKGSLVLGAEAGIQEPEVQSIDRMDPLTSGEEPPDGDKLDVLKKWKNTTGFVKVSNIPKNYTYEKMLDTVTASGLPGGDKQLIYLDGMSEALLVCKTSEDAFQLCKYKGAPPFQFHNMEKKGVGNLKGKVEQNDLAELQKQGMYKRFKDEVSKLMATFDETDAYNIKVATSFQLECVFRLVEKLLQEDFVVIPPRAATIENVSDNVWQIMQVEKESGLEDFKKGGGTIIHTGETLTVYWDEHQHRSILTDFVNEFKSFSKEMAVLEFGEIPVESKYINEIAKWKQEIETNWDKRCCTFIPKQNKIIAYCDSYEQVKVVEHHFLVKMGKRKQTGRRRNLVGAVEYGPSSLQPTLAIQSKSENDRFEWRKDATNVKAFKSKEGIQIYVYEANILKLPVDCIVNAANSNLRHGGGVAEVIAKKAGARLTDEGNQYIQRYGDIPVGHAVPTNAGNLGYKCVVHAVGPRWSDYKKSDEDIGRCEKDLVSAIFRSCKIADEKGYVSIAFPAISSAIFGVPEDLCVCQYVKATIEFSKINPQSLMNIHFIDKNSAIITKIQQEFKTVLEDSKESPYQRQTYVLQARGLRNSSQGSRNTSRLDHSNNKFSDSIKSKQTPTSSSYSQKNVLQTLDNQGKLPFYTTERGEHVFFLGGDENHHVLHLYKGSLFDVQSAAVVVTIDENRKGGALANHFASDVSNVKMRDQYERDLKKNLSLKSKTGDIAITKGYGTGPSHVFHVVFPLGERGKQAEHRRKCLGEIYYNIFSAGTKERNLDKIATTLIGINTSREDIDLGCNAFLDGYQRFLMEKKYVSNSHSAVYLVSRDGSSFERICSIVKSYAERQLKTKQAASETMVGQASGNQYPGKEPDEPKAKEEEKYEDCVICMDQMTNPKTLPCGHRFCTECIDQYFEIKKSCPTCGAVCGVITGDQPPGDMKVRFEGQRCCAGYPGCGQISITYTFSNGRQGPSHPNPGAWYKGITRTAYLPDNTEGKKVLEMLKVAFDRKVVFTIGRSRTTGQEGVITWNDIHHKTDPRSHSQFGYPDPTYLARVRDELAAKGVTEDDIPKNIVL